MLAEDIPSNLPEGQLKEGGRRDRIRTYLSRWARKTSFSFLTLPTNINISEICFLRKQIQSDSQLFPGRFWTAQLTFSPSLPGMPGVPGSPGKPWARAIEKEKNSVPEIFHGGWICTFPNEGKMEKNPNLQSILAIPVRHLSLACPLKENTEKGVKTVTRLAGRPGPGAGSQSLKTGGLGKQPQIHIS